MSTPVNLKKLYPVYYRGGNVVTTDGNTSGSILSGFLSSDVKDTWAWPNAEFKVRLAKRQDASLPYKRIINELVQPPLLSEVEWTSAGVTHKSRALTYTLADLSAITGIPSRPSADDIALKRLKGKLARDLDQFKALVPLAEIKETRSLIRTTAAVTTDLLKGLIELKHGKTKGVVSKASKAWLQFSFAISPTIGDTAALLSSIGSYLLREDKNAVYRGSFEEKWHGSISNPGSASAASGCSWRFRNVESHHTYKVRYTAGVNFDIKSANNYSVAEHFGVQFGEIIPLFWELTPFSWVFDYFTTTGSYLEDLFSSSGGNTLYCTKSVKYECEQKREVFLEMTNRKLVSQYRAPFLLNSLLFERTALAQLPHRAMRFKTADEIGMNSVSKVLNLASILLSK